MASLLFIGSACADVVVRVPRLPTTGGDEHVLSQQVNLGGCACNAFLAARHTGLAECSLFAPVGSGIWGDWVREVLSRRGIRTLIPPIEEENGCCYCLVEPDGERTFLSHHGAEYRFRPEWFDAVTLSDYDGVYLCGLELEESTGNVLAAALEAEPPRRLYFAPGPRIGHIPPERMARILALQPVLHLNQAEALSFTGCGTVPEAAGLLHQVTRNDVIITLGSAGAYALGAAWEGTVPTQPVAVTDTIGAGDAHIGTIMAAMAAGASLREAVQLANSVSARVVGGSGLEGF